MSLLRPEVAERYELTSLTTRLHVLRLGRTVDLTKISVDEAEELLALEGGFEWLRRKPKKDAGPALTAAGPARAKRKKGA
jgi:hypothetical protein